jgi:hypothetical protein
VVPNPSADVAGDACFLLLSGVRMLSVDGASAPLPTRWLRVARLRWLTRPRELVQGGSMHNRHLSTSQRGMLAANSKLAGCFMHRHACAGHSMLGLLLRPVSPGHIHCIRMLARWTGCGVWLCQLGGPQGCVRGPQRSTAISTHPPSFTPPPSLAALCPSALSPSGGAGAELPVERRPLDALVTLNRHAASVHLSCVTVNVSASMGSLPVHRNRAGGVVLPASCVCACACV